MCCRLLRLFVKDLCVYRAVTESASLAESPALMTELAEEEVKTELLETNGNAKILKRMETVPDIKRDTSGIVAQKIAVTIVTESASLAESPALMTELAEEEVKTELLETNGNAKILKRMETVPDIKRDTSGIVAQKIAVTIVNLGALAAGICIAWSSSLPHLSIPPSEIKDYEASWASSLLCLGALFGAVPAGLISEHFGRKKTLLYLALPLLVSWILVASSPNVYGLYVGRFIGGIAVGAFSVSIPPYVEDIAEKDLLPSLANFYHVQFTCGILFGYMIGLVQSATWASFLCSIIPISFFIAFVFIPESPTYLMSQGKVLEAKAALRHFRGIDNDIDIEIKTLKEYLRNYIKNKVTFKQLFTTKATIKAMFVSFCLMVFQQMSGIYPILFYTDQIFTMFAISLNPRSASIILGFCLVTATVFSTTLLTTVKRRVLLMLSFATMAVSLGSLAIYYHLKAADASFHTSTWLPLVLLCIYVISYAAGAGPIPWLMLREIFPPNVTRRATAITAGFHWFLAFGATKMYQYLVDLIHPGWTLWHFGVTCGIGTIFVYFFVPETKGRTLEDIQLEFDGVHKKKKHRHVIEVEYVSEC